MKEEFPRSGIKASIPQIFEPPPLPIASKSRDRQWTESASGIFLGLKVRSTKSSSDPINAHRVRRPLLNSKHNHGDYDIRVITEETDYTKIASRDGNWAVEQYSQFHPQLERNCKVYEEETEVTMKELHRRVNEGENSVKELKSEVTILKTQLEKLQSRSVELESQNKWLAENLSAAKAKISDLENHDQIALPTCEIKVLKFRDMQRIMEDKLSHLVLRNGIAKEEKNPNVKSSALTLGIKSSEVQSKNLIKGNFPPPPDHHVTMRGLPPPPPSIQHGLMRGPLSPPPPPPPPPTHQAPCKAKATQKAVAVAELYNSLTKRDGKMIPSRCSNAASAAVNNVHNSIVDEIQNRSAHLLAVKADIDTKGDFIRSLIERVQSAAFEDIDDVLTFVGCLDKELSTLSDERAVLKHFNWPEKKADALREAAFEYRNLKQLEVEASSFSDDMSLPYAAIVKKTTTLMDKLEKSIQRLIKLRDITMLSFKGCKIPTDWMLDSGMVSKIKLASVRLAKVFMKRVSMELKAVRGSEKESMHEALLCHGVHFAYRTHQFSGGLDSETLSAFEELRRRVQIRGRDPREQLPGSLQN